MAILEVALKLYYKGQCTAGQHSEDIKHALLTLQAVTFVSVASGNTFHYVQIR